MGFLDDINTLSIEEKFHKWLPNTLYMSHYELSTSYGHTPEEWRTFLRDNHLFIESELAAITEAEARAALSRLGNSSGQEVSALKALLDKSKLINDAQRQNVKVVLHFLPSTEEELKPINEQQPNNRLSSDSPVDSGHIHSTTQNVPKQEEPPMSTRLQALMEEPQQPKRVSKYR